VGGGGAAGDSNAYWKVSCRTTRVWSLACTFCKTVSLYNCSKKSEYWRHSFVCTVESLNGQSENAGAMNACHHFTVPRLGRPEIVRFSAKLIDLKAVKVFSRKRRIDVVSILTYKFKQILLKSFKHTVQCITLLHNFEVATDNYNYLVSLFILRISSTYIVR